MGVIRWEERSRTDLFGATHTSWRGDLGKTKGFICQIFPTEKNGIEYAKLELTDRFPGYEDVPGADALHFVGVENAKVFAEQILDAWADRAGLVPKSDLDDANAAYSGLYTEFLARLDQALGLAKDLRWAQAEVDRLKRVLKKIRREIDRESNRDIYCRFMKIVDDAHDWAADPAPKRRTEADFRNADIDANGYVTFRDGGAT
jgi:hypothetical protein